MHIWLRSGLMFYWTISSQLCELIHKKQVFCHDRRAAEASRESGFVGASLRFDPHGGEVGQQSDSVSDRSCHRAALTGCTLHFRKQNISTHSGSCSRLQRMHYMLRFKQTTKKSKLWDALPEKCKNINASGENRSKCNQRPDYAEELWFMLLGKIVISTAHVDLNCGKTASRAPQTGFFFLAISPRGLLTVRCHREHTESRNKKRPPTLLLTSDTTEQGNTRTRNLSADGWTWINTSMKNVSSWHINHTGIYHGTCLKTKTV